MASSLMASQATILQTPLYCYHRRNLCPVVLSSQNHLPRPRIPILTTRVSNLLPTVSASSRILCEDSLTAESPLTGSTRSAATLLALAIAVSKVVAHNLGLHLNGCRWGAMVCSAGTAFFAAAKSSTVAVNTPFTVIAAGMGKWLDIYSGVLMIRVLLSWFPNIPWERQPLSAIRDLCDPYLNLFRNIIPPIFDTLDVSPLLAFAVLGTLGSILSGTKVF
ncbi:unnamed protein product [Cuscuta europaea]|uniref:Uncharacterized protein n=1 Tax=Cuscuta europaea TaxID=41803 RepID=A0A9P1ENL7_CUSEU|nr:unnamed protein product [Cuscuta europaea]